MSPAPVKYQEWARLISGLNRPPDISYHLWSAWKRGCCRPASTRIAWAAKVLGITEAAVIFFAGHHPGCKTAAELQEHLKAAGQAKANARRRLLYAAGGEYRAEVLASNRARQTAKREAQRQESPSARQVHLDYLASLSGDERRKRVLRLKRNNRAKRAAEGYRRQRVSSSTPEGRLVNLRNKIINLRRRVEHAERQWARMETVAGKPWGLAGYPTKRLWKAHAPDAFHDWQLAEWSAKTYRRDARKAGLLGKWSGADWFRRLADFGYRCVYCGVHRQTVRAVGFDLEADHVIPLTHAKAHNYLWGIVPACKSCNASKGNRDLLEWATEKGFALKYTVTDIYYRTLGETVSVRDVG